MNSSGSNPPSNTSLNPDVSFPECVAINSSKQLGVSEMPGTGLESNSTLVLGLGNPLRGDDGFGPAVIQWLRARGLPPGVDAVDGGTAGLELALTWQGYRRALIVDAAGIGRAPGEWMRFAPDRLRLRLGSPSLSLHDAGLAEALALSAALDTLPQEMVVFGAQPGRVDWSPGLSEEMQGAVEAVGWAVLEELDGKDTHH